MHQLSNCEAFLRGTVDEECAISKLRGVALPLEAIVKDVREAFYKAHVEDPAPSKAFIAKSGLVWFNQWENRQIRDGVRFPPPTGINVNMMPIKYYDLENTLPDFLKGYAPLIRECPVAVHKMPGYQRIVYLTVHESPVAAGETQRRPGLHIERPAKNGGGGGYHAPYPHGPIQDFLKSEYRDICWGLGFSDKDGMPVDGIYMASTVDDSCAVWSSLVRDPHAPGVTDACGGIEHMRSMLGPPAIVLKANQLCWITDRTPHESLPVARETYRQFFRLVVGPVSVWYSKHNTANPTGLQPDAPISHEDKFADVAKDVSIHS